MPRIPDLVRDSELETQFHLEHTVHVYSETDLHRRRIRREEHWKFERHLGQGSYGNVWLERCTAGQRDVTLRAVKMIRKQQHTSKTTNYNRELEAIAKFSHSKV